MADLPILPQIYPAPGLVWVAGGLPALPSGVAVRRYAALFSAPSQDLAANTAALRDAREVTLLPSHSGSPGLVALLPSMRRAAPEAVLRLEWWLGDAASLDEYLPALRAAQPLFVHAVVTAPEQTGGDWGECMQRLLTGGIPMAAEIMLRCGGIDGLAVARALCLGLLKAGVRPYVLVDGAWLPDAERVPRDAALEIVRGLRGWISGLAVPQLVEESRDGVRTPVIPAYVERLDGAGVEVVNFEGRRLRYSNPPKDPK